MPQHFSLYGDLTVAENMKFFADFYGVPGRDSSNARKTCSGSAPSALLKTASPETSPAGCRKSSPSLANLFHTPEILLLDEPTTGVDPVSRQELWKLLAELHDQGVTILITTPYMDEAARCERVGFIHEGRILAYDTPPALIRGMTDEIAELVAPLTPALNALREFPDLKSVHIFGRRNSHRL